MNRHPGFWMHETSGVLRPAAIAYLEGRDLSPEEIATLRSYLRQWIGATVWDENPHAGNEDRTWLTRMRERIDTLNSREAISRWTDEALIGGVDPW